ncbi:hypothetical protein [Sansalvadorimonas verongulae]|uniref:hypothetical protein n=1 Tax=Sansalvadorimonas verongulae TaxID=2172824 RepID=UPI0012BD3CD0|nr:hypothetical protein [Sansalvadorimonas verongulae]MTI13070.1 hypothetical protein [Sansalvadorimonas verongulae]
MHENSNKILQCLRDKDFAEEEGFRVVLVVSGNPVQIVPPKEGQGVPDETIAMYTRYVHNSIVHTQRALTPLKELNKKIKASTGRLKKLRGKLKKELGIKVLAKAEKEWIENTRIILTLQDGTGWVNGGRQAVSYIPDAALKQKQTHGLKPDALIVDTDSDTMKKILDSDEVMRTRPADQSFEPQGDDDNFFTPPPPEA